ncbi:MAG: tetratricopeptide repeat protein, partial [Acidobacteriota bacterium]
TAAQPGASVLRARVHAGAADALRLTAEAGGAIEQAEQAVALARRAADLREDADAGKTLEHALAVLAAAQTASGAADQAVITYRSLVERQERSLGPDHPRLSITYRGLSHALEVAGEYAAGGESAENALRISRAVLGDEHPVVAFDLANVAASHRVRGQYAEAVELLREASSALEATRPQSLARANTLAEIGMCLEELGQPDDAVAAHREAVAIQEKVHGPDHPDLGPGLSRLSSALRAADRAGEALPISRRAVQLVEAAHPDGHWQVVVTLAELTQALVGAGEFEAAVERADAMTAMARDQMGERHVMHAAVQTIRADALIRSALDLGQAERLAQAAAAIALSRAIFEEQQGAQSPNLSHVDELEVQLGEASAELGVE